MINPANQVNPTILELTRTLAAGEETSIAMIGNFVAGIEATADFELGYNSGPKTSFRKGYRHRTDVPFQSVEIRNPSGSSNTITLLLGKGDFLDGRLTISSGINTTETHSSTVPLCSTAPIGAGTFGLVAAANASRRELIVSNDSPGDLFVNTGFAARYGILLPSGASVSIENTGAWYVYNPQAATANVSYLETQ